VTYYYLVFVFVTELATTVVVATGAAAAIPKVTRPM
jgi:hypothetical protein